MDGKTCLDAELALQVNAGAASTRRLQISAAGTLGNKHRLLRPRHLQTVGRDMSIHRDGAGDEGGGRDAGRGGGVPCMQASIQRRCKSGLAPVR